MAEAPKSTTANVTATPAARELAFLALCSVEAGAYADAALDRTLRRTAKAQKEKTDNTKSKSSQEHSSGISPADRRLLTELLYGCIRRQRTLDALIDQFAKKPATQQPPKLRLLLHLGLYQLRYLDHIPDSAAVNTTVELAKSQGLKGLSGFVNGVLRAYSRAATDGDPLKLPEDPIQHVGVLHSYPDWIVETWRSQLSQIVSPTSEQQSGEQPREQQQMGSFIRNSRDAGDIGANNDDIDAIAQWFNQPPTIDLRINPLKTERTTVQTELEGVSLSPELLSTPQGLRLRGAVGPIQILPGFEAGHWMVQDSSAQLVAHLLNPQPGETVIDACAAPGGKTAHIAELMQNTGVIWACDRTASRLKKLKQNAKRLGLKNIRIHEGDSTDQPQFVKRADRVLLDVPCSGLGTLHRHADARWRQSPKAIAELAQLQQRLLAHASTWVKGNGILVYATCTLHPLENEQVIQTFLNHHPQWKIHPPEPDSPACPYAQPEGWCKVWPHRANQDGFFMVRLAKF